MQLDLLDFKEEANEVQTKWKFNALLQLPWKPRLAAAGGTKHVIDKVNQALWSTLFQPSQSPERHVLHCVIGPHHWPPLPRPAWPGLCQKLMQIKVRKDLWHKKHARHKPLRAVWLMQDSGRVIKHIESWDVEPSRVVQQLLKPASKSPSSKAELFMLALSQGDAKGMWLTSADTSLLASSPVVLLALVLRSLTGNGLPVSTLGIHPHANHAMIP